MNSIQLYSNEVFSVRTTKDENGIVWFVAKDIAEALEYSEATISNMEKTIGMVPEVWKGRYPIPTPGGKQEMLCLTEQGVYFFLGRSDKPKALPYQMWIAGEVVPSIRETGSYSIASQSSFTLKDQLDAAKVVLETADIKGNQLTLALDKVYRRCTGFSMLEATGVQLIAPEKKQLLNPTEIGRQVGLNAREVNKLLAYAGYQHNINGRWEPLELGMPYAVMLDTGKPHGDGTPIRQLKWNSDILSVVESLREDCA